MVKKSRLKSLCLLSVILLNVSAPNVAQAINPSDYMRQNILMRNPDSGCSTDSGSAAVGGATGALGETERSAILEQILRFFTEEAGMTLKQAAAIAGNFQQESGFNPMAKNSIGAIGLAQWLDRADKLRTYKGDGLDPDNIPPTETQLEFVMVELYGSESRAREIFVANSESASVGQLAVIFGEAYERYGPNEEGGRAEFAEQIYNTYKGEIPDGKGMRGDSSASGSAILPGSNTNDPCASATKVSASSSAIVKVAMEWTWESHMSRGDPTEKYAKEAPEYSSIASQNYTDCTYFVGSVMRKVLNQKVGEEGFPEAGTEEQLDYLLNRSGGKFKLVPGATIDQLQPGDIIVTPLGSGGRDIVLGSNGQMYTVANHIAIYGGEDLLGSGLTHLEASQGTFAPQRSERSFLEFQFKSSKTVVIRATGALQDNIQT